MATTDNKTVLVTGGAGFLGSYLIKKLLDETDYDIICLDDFTSSTGNNITNIKSDRFTFVKHNVINPYDPNRKIHQIYHMACAASPPLYQDDPLKTAKTNCFGTLNMLKLAKKYDADFLITSTSEVYGDPTQHPQKEEYWGNVNTMGDRSCYDEGKRFAETLCYEYTRLGAKVHVARIFNTYGPNMLPTDGRVVSNFVMQSMTDGKITIYGNGLQTRSLCYVSDTINGLIALMNSKEVGPINIGNPEEHTIKELAEIITELVKKKGYNKNPIEFVYKDLPNDDPKKRQPDITQAKSKLSWEPIIELNDGLDITIEYFKQFAK